MSTETLDDLDNDVDPAAERTPEAPYGYQQDGVTPRSKPGRKPGQRTGTGRSSRTAAPPPPPRKVTPQRKASSGPPRPPQGKTATNYRPALKKLTGELITGIALTGLMRNNTLLVADAAALANGQDGLIEIVNQAADQYGVVAAILDKLLAAGPYMEGGLSVAVMVGQLAVNHGAIPPGLIPGTLPPDRLLSNFLQKQMEENETFAAAMAHFQQSHAPQQPVQSPHDNPSDV